MHVQATTSSFSICKLQCLFFPLLLWYQILRKIQYEFCQGFWGICLSPKSTGGKLATQKGKRKWVLSLALASIYTSIHRSCPTLVAKALPCQCWETRSLWAEKRAGLFRTAYKGCCTVRVSATHYIRMHNLLISQSSVIIMIL